MMKNLIIISFLITLFSCAKPINEKNYLIKKWYIDYEDSTTWIKKDIGSIKGKYYSHTNSEQVYGQGLLYPLHDSLINCDLKIKFSFLARMHGTKFSQNLLIDVQNDNNVFKWINVDISPRTLFLNKWFEIKDSVQFRFEVIKGGNYVLKIFPYCTYKGASLDLDELKVELSKVVTLK